MNSTVYLWQERYQKFVIEGLIERYNCKYINQRHGSAHDAMCFSNRVNDIP